LGQRQFLSKSINLALSVGIGLSGLSFSKSFALTPSARTYYLQAIQAERRGQLDVAEQALRKAISVDPTDYLNFVKLAAVLNQEGKPNEAVSYLQQAAILNPSDDMIQYSLGSLYEQLGQQGKAEVSYLQALRKNSASQTMPGVTFVQPMYYFALLNLSRTEIQLKKYSAATKHYESFLTHYPQHFEARRRLANLYLVTGQNPQAVQQYEILKQRFPGTFEDNVSLAKALTGVNEPQKALEELQVAYAREGNKADIMEEMGRANAALGQTNLAISNYKRAYSLNPSKETLLLTVADLYTAQGQWNGAIEQYQLYLKQHPEDLGTHRQLADAYLENQQYDLALNELSELLNRTDNPGLRYGLQKDIAYSTHMLGDLPKAIGLYEGLLLMPEAANDLQLRMNLALAYQKIGQNEQAAEYFKQVYAGTPERLQAYHINRDEVGGNLAMVLATIADADYKKKDWAAAVSHYGEATIYANHNDVAPYLGLGNAYYALKQNDKAYEAYGEVLARQPRNVTARLYRSQIELASKQNATNASEVAASNPSDEQSIATIEGLAKEQPENTEVLISLGDAYLQKNRDPEAIAAYERALQVSEQTLSPQAALDATAKYNLLMSIGSLWQKQNNFSQARDAYTRAEVINSGFADLHYNLGIVNNELGDLSRSEAEYQKTLTIDPNFSDARYGLAITQDKMGHPQEALQSYELYTQAPNAHYVTDARERIQYLQKNQGKAVTLPPKSQMQQATKSPVMSGSPNGNAALSNKNTLPNKKVTPRVSDQKSTPPRRVEMMRVLPSTPVAKPQGSSVSHPTPTAVTKPAASKAPVQPKVSSTTKLSSGNVPYSSSKKPVASAGKRIDPVPFAKTDVSKPGQHPAAQMPPSLSRIDMARVQQPASSATAEKKPVEPEIKTKPALEAPIAPSESMQP
jgi:tetratricopeptide (TPR) repeat protein